MPMSRLQRGRRSSLDADPWLDLTSDYLAGNVAGGEGYDWYYHSPEAAAAQSARQSPMLKNEP
jgi:hypothetical protein